MLICHILACNHVNVLFQASNNYSFLKTTIPVSRYLLYMYSICISISCFNGFHLIATNSFKNYGKYCWLFHSNEVINRLFEICYCYNKVVVGPCVVEFRIWSSCAWNFKFVLCCMLIQCCDYLHNFSPNFTPCCPITITYWYLFFIIVFLPPFVWWTGFATGFSSC